LYTSLSLSLPPSLSLSLFIFSSLSVPRFVSVSVSLSLPPFGDLLQGKHETERGGCGIQHKSQHKFQYELQYERGVIKVQDQYLPHLASAGQQSSSQPGAAIQRVHLRRALQQLRCLLPPDSNDTGLGRRRFIQTDISCSLNTFAPFFFHHTFGYQLLISTNLRLERETSPPGCVTK
jgi:hypothetical protein